ncbi:uncharacterized protein TNCV_1523581 [Trichonephila clavipes]|nr:uncharacterized protein TNCV_1523581 [Trichonephila clavipes]
MTVSLKNCALLVRLFCKNNDYAPIALENFRALKGMKKGIGPMTIQGLEKMMQKFEETGFLHVQSGPYFFGETDAFDPVTVTFTGHQYECFLCNPVILDLQQRGWKNFYARCLHAEIVEVEIEVVSPSIVPSGNFAELNRTVTCMVLKANDRRTSCPCHDEFRGPRSDYVRQVDKMMRKRLQGLDHYNFTTKHIQVASQYQAGEERKKAVDELQKQKNQSSFMLNESCDIKDTAFVRYMSSQGPEEELLGLLLLSGQTRGEDRAKSKLP